MSRVTLRLLVLLPLLAAGIDLTRATIVCGPDAQTCLEAAGRGWLGPLAVLLVVVVALAAALLVARGGRRTGASFTRLWALGTAGTLTACTAQAAVAALAGGTALGGSPLTVLVLSVVAGAFLALAMRVADEAAELLRPRAPRAPLKDPGGTPGGRSGPALVYVEARDTSRGRAPPRD